MSGRRRRSKKLKKVHLEVHLWYEKRCVGCISGVAADDEFEESFTMDKVKENMSSIGERFTKFIIEGVQSENREKVKEMATSVRQMRKFLIARKKRVEHSNSSRQLKQLETLSPMLDSANYLSSVAKDYLEKVEENRENVKHQEHEEVNEHDRSFVDMFVDESQENAGRKSEQQKHTSTEDDTRNISQPLKATPSRSILKTACSETPGIQKKLSFAQKATNVYQDNQTSQISLAKSSGSVKSVDGYDPKAPNFQPATETGSNSEIIFGTQKSMQENSRQGSEDLFDDAESIVDTSFQEDTYSSGKPKNVKLFKAKQLMDFSQLSLKTDDSTESANQVNLPQNEPQGREPDPLLSQEFAKNNASESTKYEQTDATQPFHNFFLKIPHDSSGSESSLDARVNMAINLVNMKPREPEMYQQVLPDKVETPDNSTDGIVPSSVTCTDFHWLEPMDYTQGTSQDALPQEEPKLPATIFEDAVANQNLLPPFDIHNANETKVPNTPFSGTQPQEAGGHGHETHPQFGSALFPPKPTWAKFTSSNQAVQIKPVAAGPEKSIKVKLQSLVLSDNCRNSKVKKVQVTKPPKKGEMPKLGKIGIEAHQQPIQERLNQLETAKNSRQSQHLKTKRAETVPNGSKFSQGTQKPNYPVDMLQETFDSHKVAETFKLKIRQSFKNALKDAVQTAARRQPADEARKQVPADSKIAEQSKEQPEPTSKTAPENSRLARLRRFGKSWTDQSSTSLPDIEIIPKRTQSISTLSDAPLIGNSKPIKGKGVVNTKSPVKRKPQSKSKPSQEQNACSKEHQGKLDCKDKVSHKRNSAKVGRDNINTKQQNEESSNKQPMPLGKKWATYTQKPMNNFNLFPSSTTPLPDTVLNTVETETNARSVNLFPSSITPLPDTIMVDTAQAERNIVPGNDTAGLSNINTSSMICETSFSGEKSSQGRRKRTTSSLKKNQLSQNQQKTEEQQPQTQLKLRKGNKPVTKQSRGGSPKSANRGNLEKKCVTSTASESVLSSKSYFESQPVGRIDSLFSNMESNFQHPHPPAWKGLQPSKQDFHQAKQGLPNQDYQHEQSLSSKQDSEQTEPGFLKFQHLHVPQPVNESQHSASECGHVFQTNWREEPTQQNFPSFKHYPAQNEGFLTFQQPTTTDSFKPAINSSVSAISIPVPNQCISVKNEPRLINLQKGRQVSISKIINQNQGGGGSFFEPQPENESNPFAQLFYQPSDIEYAYGQTRGTLQNDRQFDLSSTSQYEPSNQHFPTEMDEQMRSPLLPPSEPKIQASNVNSSNFGQINTASGGRKDNIRAETQRTVEERVPLPTTVPNIQSHREEKSTERTAGSQTSKRTGKRGKKQPKSPKIIKLDENETQNKDTDNLINFLGTQGTEVLYEECDKLSWASDDFPDTLEFDSQMINTEMFDTQMINTEMLDTRMINTHFFDSQPLSQNADPPAASNGFQTGGNEYKQTENEFQYEAHTQLYWDLAAEDTSGFQLPETREKYKHSDNHADIKETNTRNNFNEQSSNTLFRKKEPKHSETAQNLSEMLVSFTEFKSGVHVTSTEQTEKAKPLRNARFKEPAEKKKGGIEKNQHNFKPSTNSAGTEQTSASATHIQDYGNTQYHLHDPECHSEANNIPTNSNQLAHNDLSRGFLESTTALSANKKAPETAKQKTEDEEIEELINSIEWVRQIPESELIEAVNIEELINDQTFVW